MDGKTRTKHYDPILRRLVSKRNGRPRCNPGRVPSGVSLVVPLSLSFRRKEGQTKDTQKTWTVTVRSEWRSGTVIVEEEPRRQLTSNVKKVVTVLVGVVREQEGPLQPRSPGERSSLYGRVGSPRGRHLRLRVQKFKIIKGGEG